MSEVIIKMDIPCSEKCPYNINGICKKDNCICDIGYITGTNSCPFNPIISPQASEDHKRFLTGIFRSAVSVS